MFFLKEMIERLRLKRIELSLRGVHDFETLDGMIRYLLSYYKNIFVKKMDIYGPSLKNDVSIHAVSIFGITSGALTTGGSCRPIAP